MTGVTKRKIIVITVPILVLLIIIGSIIAIVYATTDAFKSKQSLFWKYISQNGNLTSILENDKFSEQKEFIESQSYDSTGDITFSLSQGEDSTTSFNVETTARHDVTTNRTYADATLKNGDLDLFTISYIKSTDETNGDVYALKASDVVDVYVGFRNTELKELAAKYSLSTDIVPDTIDIDDYLDVLSLTEEQKSHIINTYLPIIQSLISEDSYTKSSQEVQIDGATYKTNVYSVQLSGDQVKQMLIQVLEELKTDTETMVLISNKASTLNLGVDYTDITNLTVKINDLEEIINSMTIAGTTEISVYENSRQTVRTVISIEDVLQITYDQVGDDQILTIDYTQGSLEELMGKTEETTETDVDVTEGTTDTEEDTNTTDEETTNTEATDSTNTTEDESTTDEETTSNAIDTNIVIETPLSDVSSSDATTVQQVSELTVNTEETTNEESDVIDLETAEGVEVTQTEDSSVTPEVTEIVITKTTTDQNTSNNIFIVEDINSESTNSISITYDMSSVADNTINSTYSIVMISNESQPSSTVSITYTTTTVAADEVDEIEELTDSNAVLANNDDYEADEFMTFFNNWLEQIESIVIDKLNILGITIDDGTEAEEETQEEEDTAQEEDSSDSSSTVSVAAGSVGTIEIPATGVSLPISATISSAAMEEGVVIVYPSASNLNEAGNTVIAGHNYSNIFGGNKNLEEGDLIYITDSTGRTITYEVYDKYETSLSDTDYMARRTYGVREISLSTCTDDDQKRLIILAKETT